MWDSPKCHKPTMTKDGFSIPYDFMVMTWETPHLPGRGGWSSLRRLRSCRSLACAARVSACGSPAS